MLRSANVRAVGLAAMMVAGLLPCSALAQLYPVPYATLGTQSETSGAVSGGWVPGGGLFGTPGNTVSMAGGPVYGFYNKNLASQVARFINQGINGSNGCSESVYDEASRNFDQLYAAAQANLKNAETILDSLRHALAYTDRKAYSSWLYYEDFGGEPPDLPDDFLNKIQAAKAAVQHWESDKFALGHIVFPDYRHCGQATTHQAGTPPPAPTPSPPSQPGTGPTQSLFGPTTLPGLETPQGPVRSTDQTAMVGPFGSGVVLSFDPAEYASGTTTFTTAFDKMTVRYHTEQMEFGGLAYAGPAFAYVKTTVGVDPNGNSTDVFAGGGAFTSDIRTGMTASLNAVVGYSLFQTPATSLGIMGGYYGSYEPLYGNVPGGMTQFPIMVDTWNAGQAGVFYKQSFTVGSVPFQLWGSVTGLWDRLQSGAFTGDGGGVKANATLSFAAGPGRIRITGQYTDLNASGNALGLSQQVNAQNWYIGAGYSVPFGGVPPIK
jgi:hypothetical protein